MSISTRERLALVAIENRLSASDPHLTSLLATFTRLASDEEMPVRERIAQPRLLRDRAVPTARRSWRQLGWQRGMLLLWLVVAVGLLAIALAVSRAGVRRACPAAWLGCTVPATSHMWVTTTPCALVTGPGPGQAQKLPSCPPGPRCAGAVQVVTVQAAPAGRAGG